MKNRANMVVLIGVFCVFGAGLSACGTRASAQPAPAKTHVQPVSAIADDPVLAHISGEPVSYQEFMLFFDRQRSDIYRYFKQTYNVDPNPLFWESTYGGEIPLERAKQLAMEQLTQIKVQQALAKRYGLVQDMRFATLLSDWQQENQRRAEVVQQGGVIYGPVRLDMHDYYTYLNANLAHELERVIAVRQPAPSEAALQARYEQERTTRFRNDDTVNVQQISVLRAQQTQLEQAQTQLQQGITFADVTQAITSTNPDSIVTSQIYNAASARRDARLNPQLREEALLLQKGQSSPIIAMGTRLYILHCVERHSGGYRSFTDVRDIVQQELINEHYMSVFDDQMRAAVIRIDQSLYQRIKGT